MKHVMIIAENSRSNYDLEYNCRYCGRVVFANTRSLYLGSYGYAYTNRSKKFMTCGSTDFEEMNGTQRTSEKSSP